MCSVLNYTSFDWGVLTSCTPSFTKASVYLRVKWERSNAREQIWPNVLLSRRHQWLAIRECVWGNGRATIRYVTDGSSIPFVGKQKDEHGGPRGKRRTWSWPRWWWSVLLWTWSRRWRVARTWDSVQPLLENRHGTSEVFERSTRRLRQDSFQTVARAYG